MAGSSVGLKPKLRQREGEDQCKDFEGGTVRTWQSFGYELRDRKLEDGFKNSSAGGLEKVPF